MATTIIDFSPSAIDTDAVAEAAKQANFSNIAPPPEQHVNPGVTSTVAGARLFHSNSPDILYVAEYIPQKDFVGSLVVWDNYYGATHYELYKRDILSASPDWKRILFIDATSLTAETKQYSPYITSKLQLPFDSNQQYCVMDADIQVDRIFQYKIKASFYPKTADINYEAILESKGLINLVPNISSTDSIFDFSAKVLGLQDYAWVVALLNPDAHLFGPNAATKPLSSFLDNSSVYVPKNLSDITNIVAESLYFFGAQATLANLLTRTRDDTEIGDFYNLVTQSILPGTNSLDYSALQQKIAAEYPSYKRLTDSIAQGTVSTKDIIIPAYDDSKPFDSLGSITLMFLRLNTILIAAVYAQSTNDLYNLIFNVARSSK